MDLIRLGVFRFLFWPFSVIYGLITHTRNKLFDRGFLKQVAFDIPVISVGNITVGGTGKTPHVEYLITLLKEKYKLAILSRGYKRSSKGFVLTTQNSSLSDIGDEPLQIKSKYPDTIVAVDNDRVNGIEKLQQKVKNLEAVILDDAFQHRYVKPGLSILLMDYNNLITKDQMLPYGNLREYACNSKRADIVIVTKTQQDLKPIDARITQTELQLFPYQKLYFTTIIHKDPIPLIGRKTSATIDWKKIADENLNVLCVTGIANPESFMKIVNQYTKNTNLISFPDHHNFQEDDLKKIEKSLKNLTQGSIILTTEKDAIRLKNIQEQIPKNIADRIFYVPIVIDFLFEKGSEFDDLIVRYIDKKQNK